MRIILHWVLAFSLLWAVATPSYAQTAQTPAQKHQAILAQFGGAVQDRSLQRYVGDLGKKLLRKSDQPNANIGFTLLNTPVVNAFATPEGQVYVTRGILALANDEAELAAVLAHEIAHITENHVQARQAAGKDALRSGLLGAVIGGIFGQGDDILGNALKSGVQAALGYMGQFSQAQEFDADIAGVEILAKAGYDPQAQADFLESLGAQHSLESRIQGKEYNPNQVSFFATHPATGDRVRKARRAAENQRFKPRGDARYQDRYLDQIDGIVYGDTADQGFVRGRDFLHPALRFAFRVPREFIISNTTQSVRANGPDNSTLVLSGERAPRGRMVDYLTNDWARDIARRERTGTLRDVRSLKINGLDAATGWMPISRKNGEYALQLTVIRLGDRVYRFAGSAHIRNSRLRSDLATATESFTALEKWQADLLQPYRLRMYKVRRGDTVSRLARRMPFDTLQLERFRTLNGLSARDDLKVGQLVKLIVE